MPSTYNPQTAYGGDDAVELRKSTIAKEHTLRALWSFENHLLWEVDGVKREATWASVLESRDQKFPELEEHYADLLGPDVYSGLKTMQKVRLTMDGIRMEKNGDSIKAMDADRSLRDIMVCSNYLGDTWMAMAKSLLTAAIETSSRERRVLAVVDGTPVGAQRLTANRVKKELQVPYKEFKLANPIGLQLGCDTKAPVYGERKRQRAA